MNDLVSQYHAQIEALQNELEKKQALIDIIKPAIKELYENMLEDQRSDLCATSQVYESIINS